MNLKKIIIVKQLILIEYFIRINRMSKSNFIGTVAQ